MGKTLLINKRIKIIIAFSIIIYVLVFVFSLFIGRYTINISNIINLNADNYILATNILFNLRLPRAILSSLAGMSLSLSGLIYQETFQNDLVSQDLLGVSSGAGVGASIAIVLGLSNYYIVSFSFILGIVTVLITVLISNVFKSKNNITLILSGIIVGSFMSSILAVIKYFVNPETQLSTIVYWLMGSFANVTYQNIIFVFPIVLVLFIILLLISHRINLIALGREETETKGINYIFYRNIIILIGTLLTAIIVSNCGTISWVGLIIPHIVKSIIGRDVNKALPLCAVFGATFMLITDMLSRTLTQSEIPISAITGIMGSIVFTIILINNSRKSYVVNNISNVKQNTILKTSVCKNTNIEYQCNNYIGNNQKVKNKDKILSTLIRLEGVCFKYNKYSDYVLNNISFDILENEMLLLYGANGSGKTTLLIIMAGIIEPTCGKVNIMKQGNLIDINKISLKEKSKHISYVKQDFANINNILIKDYLILGMVNELKFYQKPTIEQVEKVAKYAKELNISKFLDKKFFELSGGEKQLVVICQSLLQNSKILILDEPTSSLDSDNQELVISTLIKLVKNYNKTIILSTHNKEYKNIEGCSVYYLKNY